MKTINYLVAGMIGVGSLVGFNGYSQAFEKTDGQMKQYNEKGQLILQTTDYYVEQYTYDDKGQLKTRLRFSEEGIHQTNILKTDSIIPALTIFKYNNGNWISEDTYIDRTEDGKIDLKKDGSPITSLEHLKTFYPYQKDRIADEEKRIYQETKIK